MTASSSSPEDRTTEKSLLSDWTESTDASERSPSPGEPVFAPGTILAGRYRVVAPLGRGGMGEVYRADDTKLGQAVALKFVRGTLSPELLSRLYSEVRLGRQVSHPSVCRLYDVVEVEGQTFLAMEYVDGEDLASLLARIGKLPADKALDIARDLCAGLAAVHEKGIVHRDLKPANVMIDGRGRARLTDFGLAMAMEAPGKSAFAGTPPYMAPEQLAGGDVTFRSDLYGLGLILYEMVTGHRFFDARTYDSLTAQHREAKAPRLASVTQRLEAAVERAVLQCLEEDPRARPPSARAVLALLPGADPLEAAVAAGETPSPELVAAAGKIGDVTPAVAWASLAIVVGGFVLSAYLADRTGLLQSALLPKPPEVLVERARDVLARLGAGDAAVDSAFSFDWDQAHIDHVARNDTAPDRWERLRRAPLSPFFFFYRQSPSRLIATNRDGMVLRDDPPLDVAGMAEVVLEPHGRLLRFQAVPPQVEAGRASDPDWSPLFEEAGLDPGAFRASDPRWASPVDSDRKAAWEGTYAGDPRMPVRIEAAAYHGRPVWFAVLPPWAGPAQMGAGAKPSSPTPVGEAGVWILALAMPLGGFVLARRNLRLGRGDRKGAAGVAVFVFVTYSVARLFRADHVSTFRDELWILIRAFAYPSFWAIQVWLLYMALEPYVRRRWPHVLISWKRLLSGRLRDPLVGRDVLMGTVLGTLMVVLYRGTKLVPVWRGQPMASPEPFVTGATLTALRQVGFRIFVNQFSAVLYAMVFLFMLVLLRMLLRKPWLALPLWCLLVGGPALPGESPWSSLLRAVLLLLVLARGGLLAMATTLFFMFVSIEAPFTLDVSAWYASRALPVLAVLVGLVVYAFHTALGGKPMFGGALLED
jgi:serine/threonine-protein kinase